MRMTLAKQLSLKKNEMIRETKLRNFIESEEFVFYCIIAPFLIMFLILKVFPFAWGIFMSFTNYNGFNGENLKFIGFNNYIRVLTDSEAVNSFLRTFVIGLLVVPVNLVICNILSILLNQGLKFIGIFRTIFYLPSIIPVVALGIIWKTIFYNEGGLLNTILNSIGISSVNWLGYDFIFISLLIVMYWGAGGGVLFTLAAIKNIPEELFEAAEIDGASSIQKIFTVTLPMISSINFLNLLMGIIGMLQLFGQPVMLSGASGITSLPLGPVYTYVVHVYQQIFVNLRLGYGLSMIWMVFIVIMLLTFLTNKTSKLWVHYEVDQGGEKNEK
jgi:ABC-type sugar transport system permease subunit